VDSTTQVSPVKKNSVHERKSSASSVITVSTLASEEYYSPVSSPRK
jgi:hypothetical protein